MAVAVLKVDKLFEAATKHAREMRDLRNAHESKLGELTDRVDGMGRNERPSTDRGHSGAEGRRRKDRFR